MSERSQRLAAYARQFLSNQPLANEANINRNRLLDEGFLRLKESMRLEFEAQTEEFNREPGCGNVLVCNFSNDKSSVSRMDDPESQLLIQFDPHIRMVSIKCERPVKLTFYVGVKLTTNETNWYYVAGEKKTELSPCNDRVDWVVDKALYALFGVRT